MIQQYLCDDPDHQNQEALFCCLDDNCSKDSPFCNLCIQKYHGNHQQLCFEFYQIVQIIETSLINPFIEEFTTTLDNKRALALKCTSAIKQAIKKQLTADQQLGLTVHRGKAIKQLLTQYLSSLSKINSIILSSCSIIETFFQQLEKSIINLNNDQQIQYRCNIKDQLQNINQRISEIEEFTSKSILYTLSQYQPNQLRQIPAKKVVQENDFENLPGYEKYIQTLSKCQQNHIDFEDFEFPPNDDSVGIGEQLWARLRQSFGKDIKFFYKKDHNIFGSSIDVALADISSGFVGNDMLFQVCYLIANHSPKQLEKAFVTKDISNNNIYALRLCKNGIEQIVFVDDYVPIHPAYEMPMTIFGSNSSIWISILEKALAKLYGKYTKLQQILPFFLIENILHSPPILFQTNDENLLSFIKEELNQNSLVTGFFQKNDNITVCQILGICRVKHSNLNEIDLIQLRTTKQWWKGEWSDQSPLWNQGQKIKLDDGKKNIIYMDQYSFISAFYVITSNRTINVQISHSLTVCSRKKQATYFKINIDEPANYLITFRPLLEQQRQLIESLLTIVKVEGNSYTFTESFINPNLGYANAINLQKGVYIGYAKIYWDHLDGEDAIISINGPHKAGLTQIQKIPNLLYQPLLQKAFETGSYQKCLNLDGYLLDYRLKGYMVISVVNNTDQLVCFKQQLNQNANTKFMKPHKSNLAFIQIEPYQKEAIIIKTRNNTRIVSPMDMIIIL